MGYKDKEIYKKGEATQFPHNDPTKGGRKPSIKNQIKELLNQEGRMKIKAQDVLLIEDNGDVVIKVPTEMQIAMKLKQWAMSKKGNDSIKAIQMIMEQIDGKPKERHEHSGAQTIIWQETKTYEADDKADPGA